MAPDHVHCPQGGGWTSRTEDCPPWCEHHFDSTLDPSPYIPRNMPPDPDFLSHVGEWDPVARVLEATEHEPDAHVALRFSSGEEDYERSPTHIDLRLPMEMDIVSLSPQQARQLVEAINLRLFYLQ